MKQSKLVRKMINACLNNDFEEIVRLKKEEFKKVFKRKAKNKPFNGKWTILK